MQSLLGGPSSKPPPCCLCRCHRAVADTTRRARPSAASSSNTSNNNWNTSSSNTSSNTNTNAFSNTSSNSGSSMCAGTSDSERLRLGLQFPNAILLPDSRLPPLYVSKHYLCLTNGLAFAPLCKQLSLPFSVVRIRSTCLEQQLLEALVLELDAGLLLPLALGHSCIMWDCGARNKSNGAPRAIWYGLEFVRYALHRSWLGSGGAAHLRGYDVSRDFEQACRSFAQSTKKRLRYYKRFVTPAVVAHGIQLAGIFTRANHDEDVEFFVQQALQHCGPASTSSSSSDGHAGAHAVDADSQAFQDAQLSQKDIDAYKVLAAAGCGLFTAGLSHTQYRELQAAGVLSREGEPNWA